MKSRCITLLITVLVLLFFSGCAKRYVSTVTIQFTLHTPSEAENALRALLQPQNTAADLIPIRNTELFQIRVTDADSKKAADEANRLAAALQSQIKTSYPDAKMLVWEFAEPMSKKR